MNKGIAFIFPGQGSQYPGMGKDFLAQFSSAKAIMNQANEILGYDLEKLCIQGPEEELNNTRNTQPAIFIISMIINNLLQEEGLQPAYLAGHSLGEYSALAAAEVFTLETGLELVRERGKLMDEADPEKKGTMAAIIGLEIAQMEEICRSVGGICEIANHNSPEQIVISGEKEALTEARELALDKGAKRAIELKVSGAFHSSLMEKARSRLYNVLEPLEFNKPRYSFVANVTGKEVNEPDEIKDLLLEQLTGRVRWVDSMNYIIQLGVSNFIEVGPGKVLKGLMRRINRSVNVYTVENINDFQKTLEDLG